MRPFENCELCEEHAGVTQSIILQMYGLFSISDSFRTDLASSSGAYLQLK